jgi:Fe-S oxidoreductase
MIVYDYYVRYFAEIALTHDLTTLPEERRWRLAPPGRDPEPHRIVLWLGCNVLRTSHMARTIVAIFDRLGLDAVAVAGPAYCCGIQHHQRGHVEPAGGMNRRTLHHLAQFRPEEVVAWCPSCLYFTEEVAHTAWPFRVRHATEFLVAHLDRLAPSARVDRTVALHSHVAGEPRRREGLAARRLLAAVPGVRLVDLEPEPRFGRACAPSVQAEVGAALWATLVRAEIDRALAGGADTLATIYHGCQRLMCGFEAERPIVIEHYLSVFARSLGIDFPDTYKHCVLVQDPERVLAETTPCQQANGIDAGRAREFVTATFGPRPTSPDGGG